MVSSSNSPFFSASESAPPALGYSSSSTKDPPEPEPLDGSCSDDLYGGPEEVSEEPVETKKPVETEKHDSVDDLLEGSFDTDALMDISRDYKSGSENEGLGSEGIFEMDTIVPVSPIYRRSAKGVVGSGVSALEAGFYESSDDEDEKKKDGVETNVDEETDIGTGSVVAGEDVGVTKTAAVAAEVSPVVKESDDLTNRDDANAPKEHLVTVAAIIARDGDGEGHGWSATTDGSAAGGHGEGPPGPDLQAQYGVVPELLIAPNMDMFNRLLVRLGSSVIMSYFHGFLLSG